MIELREATLLDALELDENMREADAAELIAEGYAQPFEGVIASMEISIGCWAVRSRGELLAIMGYAMPEIVGRTATPWMVSSTAAERHRIAFARASRQVITEMRREFTTLENWVDARHRRSIEWLRWLGFTIHPAIAIAPSGLPFHRFEIGGL